MPKRPARQQPLTFERPPFSLTADDLTRPDPSRTLWTDPATGKNYVVSVEWAVVLGRPEPVSFSVRGARSDSPAGLEQHLPVADEAPATITAMLLRRLSPGDIIDQARRDAGRAYSEWLDEHPSVKPEPTTTDKGSQEWTLEQLTAAQSAPFRGTEPTPMQQEVARVWWEARRAGKPTTKAVSEHFKIGYSAAAQRVARARAAGLLPPTTRGRAVAEPPVTREVPRPAARRRRRSSSKPRKATRADA